MPEEIVLPNLDWYHAQSQEKGLPEHCPYAENETCYRYWATKLELGIVKSESYVTNRINKEWENKNIDYFRPLPKIDYMDNEHKKLRYYKNLCQEAVSEYCYQLFLTGITFLKPTEVGKGKDINSQLDERYIESHISDDCHRDKEKFKAWLSSIYEWEPMHYSECPVYQKFPKSIMAIDKPDELQVIGADMVNLTESDEGILIIEDENNNIVFKLNKAEMVVYLKNQKMPLSKNQMKVVEVFVRNYHNKTYVMAEGSATRKANVISRRLHDVFKNYSERLDALFVKVDPGKYRLKID